MDRNLLRRKMATFAVIENGTVKNVIVADSLENAQSAGPMVVEYTPEKPAGIGWTWDGENFIPPVIEEQPTE
jgi:hypothetical protein